MENTAMQRDRIRDIEGTPWRGQRGAAGWIFLWLVGIPVPLLILFFVLRGCT
jgi:hypothetical protein